MSTISYIGSTNAPRELSLYLNSRDANYPTPRSYYNPDTEMYTTSNDSYHTDCEYHLTNPLAISHDVDTLLSCTSVAVPHSFYNITAGINDCIYFSVLLWQGSGSTPNQFRAIVEPGFYDASEFATAIQTAMNLALKQAVPANIPDFKFDVTVKYSAIRHKLYFNFGKNQSIGPFNPPDPPPDIPIKYELDFSGSDNTINANGNYTITADPTESGVTYDFKLFFVTHESQQGNSVPNTVTGGVLAFDIDFETISADYGFIWCTSTATAPGKSGTSPDLILKLDPPPPPTPVKFGTTIYLEIDTGVPDIIPTYQPNSYASQASETSLYLKQFYKFNLNNFNVAPGANNEYATPLLTIDANGHAIFRLKIDMSDIENYNEPSKVLERIQSEIAKCPFNNNNTTFDADVNDGSGYTRLSYYPPPMQKVLYDAETKQYCFKSAWKYSIVCYPQNNPENFEPGEVIADLLNIGTDDGTGKRVIESNLENNTDQSIFTSNGYYPLGYGSTSEPKIAAQYWSAKTNAPTSKLGYVMYLEIDTGVPTIQPIYNPNTSAYPAGSTSHYLRSFYKFNLNNYRTDDATNNEYESPLLTADENAHAIFRQKIDLSNVTDWDQNVAEYIQFEIERSPYNNSNTVFAAFVYSEITPPGTLRDSYYPPPMQKVIYDSETKQYCFKSAWNYRIVCYPKDNALNLEAGDVVADLLNIGDPADATRILTANLVDNTENIYTSNGYYPNGYGSESEPKIADTYWLAKTNKPKLIEVSSEVFAVRITFLQQGIPYTGPGAGLYTTTNNAGMFIEDGMRRDVPSYMQIGNQSLSPVTAAYDPDTGKWSDFSSDPAQLPTAPFPGMPTPHAIDLNANQHNLYVRTSLTPESSMSSMEGGRGSKERLVDFASILTCIATTETTPGQVISNTIPMWDHPTRLQLTKLDYIRVQLTDTRNQLIDLNGCHFSITLRLGFIMKNARKMPLSKLESRLIGSVHDRGTILKQRIQYQTKIEQNTANNNSSSNKKKKKSKKKKKKNGNTILDTTARNIPVAAAAARAEALGPRRETKIEVGANAEKA